MRRAKTPLVFTNGRAQLAEGFGEARQGPGGVEAAGVGEDPEAGGADVLLLGADGCLGGCEGDPVGGYAGNGHVAGAAVLG